VRDVNVLIRVEEGKAKLYRALVPLVPSDFRDDLRLLALHAERNAKLLKKAKIRTERVRTREIETALEFLEKALSDPETSVEDYYRYAIDAERASARLYRRLSMKAEKERWRRLFKWLAEIAEEHAEMLERHLEMWEFMREESEEEEIPEDLIEQWFEDIDL
jgi:rubrerythrin